MKKIQFLVVLILLYESHTYSQTNLFPTPSGNVGIGVSGTPNTTLHIGSGTGSLHAGNKGLLIKFNEGDRALMELHCPDGQNRTVFQSLNYASYLLSMEQKPILMQGLGGSVGIGLDAIPSATLHVGSGTGNLHYGNNGVLIKFNSGDRALMELHSPDGQNRSVLQSLSDASYLFSWDHKPLVFQSEGGNVGIGKRTADTKLDIKTTQDLDGIRITHIDQGFATYRGSSLTQGAYNNITQAGDAGIVYGSNNGIGAANFGFVITPWANAESGLRIDKDGNVGIATSNTMGNRLAVNGNIICEKVKVKLRANWPDYVFNGGYPLRPLSEVEKYIQQHHHLPEVPAAEEVVKEGLDVGDNQATLLKKIEELTLYMIEQNKSLQNQQKLIEQQATLLKSQQEQLDALRKEVKK